MPSGRTARTVSVPPGSRITASSSQPPWPGRANGPVRSRAGTFASTAPSAVADVVTGSTSPTCGVGPLTGVFAAALNTTTAAARP